MVATDCAGCRRILQQGLTFSFHTRQGDAAKCLRCSLAHWPMLKRSLLIALVVGSILALLNHGDKLLVGTWEAHMSWKIPLTYCVPFLVATWGALTNCRR